MSTADSTIGLKVRVQEVLRMWLRWNDASQRLTERMFAARGDTENLRQMVDEVDRLRQEAVVASRQILSENDRS